MFSKLKSLFTSLKDKVSKVKVPDSVKRNPNVDFEFTEEGVKAKDKTKK